MADVSILDVRLYGEKIATFTLVPGDRTLFAFDKAYVDNPERSTLSLSFADPVRTAPDRCAVQNYLSSSGIKRAGTQTNTPRGASGTHSKRVTKPGPVGYQSAR